MSSTSPFALPWLRETIFSEPTDGEPKKIFYDVKFNPYLPPGTPPTFVVVGSREILVCRCDYKDKADSLKVLGCFIDDEPLENNTSAPEESVLNSVCWAYRPSSPDDHLICITGISGKIKVLNAVTGELEATLIGHGAEINDLATHPRYPWIIASASGDHSIRIWSLLPHHSSNPCLLLLGHGLAHKEGILTCSFHQSGRYLLSGGLDHLICLWTLPDLSYTRIISPPATPGSVEIGTSSNVPNPSPPTRLEAEVIHYPHFITSAVHSNYVDCVAFHGDLVISKACEENKIVLWSITNFNSSCPPLSQAAAPKTHTFQLTRSAYFKPEDDSPLFTRHLEFECPRSESFYLRFSLLRPAATTPETHPILAFANTHGGFFFWDLSRLELGYDDGYRHPTHTNTFTVTSTSKDGFLQPPSRKKRRIIPTTSSSTVASASRGTPLHSENSIPATATAVASTSSPRGRSSSLATTTETNTNTGSSSIAGNTVTMGPTSAGGVDRKLYNVSDPFRPIKAHHFISLPRTWMTARQVAWSPPPLATTGVAAQGFAGQFCVVAGESASKGLVCVLCREP